MWLQALPAAPLREKPASFSAQGARAALPGRSLAFQSLATASLKRKRQQDGAAGGRPQGPAEPAALDLVRLWLRLGARPDGLIEATSSAAAHTRTLLPAACAPTAPWARRPALAAWRTRIGSSPTSTAAMTHSSRRGDGGAWRQGRQPCPACYAVRGRVAASEQQHDEQRSNREGRTASQRKRKGAHRQPPVSGERLHHTAAAA